jgi:hypothetical protein
LEWDGASSCGAVDCGGIVIGARKEFVEVVDDKSCAAVEERLDPCATINTDDYGEAAGLSSGDSRRCVFDHNCPRWFDAEAFGAEQISVGRWLASQTLIGDNGAINDHIETTTQTSSSEHGHGVLRR